MSHPYPNQNQSQRNRSDIIHPEKRTYNFIDLSMEKREDGTPSKIVGHAAVFDTVDGPSWFREKIERGAFTESIAVDDIRALLNHDPNFVLGRTKAGTLRLREDDKGLWMEIDPPDTTVGRDLMVSIARGDISQASFAFQTVEAGWEEGEKDDIRVLRKVKLYDVSPVTYPFYEATDVSLRTRIDKVAVARKQKLRRMRLDLLRK